MRNIKILLNNITNLNNNLPYCMMLCTSKTTGINCNQIVILFQNAINNSKL